MFTYHVKKRREKKRRKKKEWKLQFSLKSVVRFSFFSPFFLLDYFHTRNRVSCQIKSRHGKKKKLRTPEHTAFGGIREKERVPGSVTLKIKYKKSRALIGFVTCHPPISPQVWGESVRHYTCVLLCGESTPRQLESKYRNNIIMG